MFHPKVRTRIMEIFGIHEDIDTLIADSEKDEVLKSILHLTIDGAADDIADMFEHLGHKILIQILVLLTLHYRELKEKDISLVDALREFRGVKEQKHYESNYYSQLSCELNIAFIEQVYCPDVSIIEYEAGIFQCIMRASNFEKSEILE